MLNSFARYTFRSRLSNWLEKRARVAARSGNVERAFHLTDLQYRTENWLTENSPFEIS